MKTTLTLAAALAAIATAVPALAQSPSNQGRGTATLYELPNFQGRSITITQGSSDLGDYKWNDRAQSAKFNGPWRACEHDEFEGRCQTIRGEVADLTTYGLMAQISSMEPAGGSRPTPGPGPGPRPGPGEGWGRFDNRGVEGNRTVFFARPTVRGMDLAAGDRNADAFCRRKGLGDAVWFDDSDRARQAVGPEGQVTGRSPVIRDLLCRKY
jgi:hypothetical protein